MKQEPEAMRYMVLCNLIETLWVVDRLDKVDFEDLLPLTSPQARRIASFIEFLFEKDPFRVDLAKKR